MTARPGRLLVLLLPLVLLGCPEKTSSRLRRAAAENARDAGSIGPMPARATLLAYGQNVPRNLLADSLNLYWLNEGRRAEGSPGVFKLPKEGGEPVALFTGKGPFAIALDDTHVYWVDPIALTVMRVAKSGGEPQTIATDQEGLSAVAVDGTHVYWAGSDAIWRAPKGGGKPQAIASDISVPMGLSVDGTYAYWYSVTAGKIARVPKKGGKPTSVASEDVTLHAFLADAANLYWSFGSEKKAQIKRMAKSGGRPVTVTTGQDIPVELTTDDQAIYWTTGDAIFRVPKSGGEAVKVVDGTDRSISVAVDGQRIYWTDRMGRIQSVPK